MLYSPDGPLTTFSNIMTIKYEDVHVAVRAQTPAPTSTPVALSCSQLTSTAGSAPKISDTVTLTCSHSGAGKDRYEYRYKVAGDTNWTDLGATNTLTVAKAGEHTAQCRVCKADDTCTAWGQAQ
jgi:hypothetical protein